MILERFGTHLDDYLSGTLDAERRREIEALLAGSPEARRELADYEQMIAALGELPDSIEPERDLFPAVEARIDMPAAGSRRWIVLAAALAAALALGYLTTFWRAPEPLVLTAAPERADSVELVGRTSTSRAQSDLLTATDQLRQTLDEHRASLPPATLELVEKNLEIIQGAIEEIQHAIDRDPNNPELNRALVAYYQHELALLEQVSRAASRL